MTAEKKLRAEQLIHMENNLLTKQTDSAII